MRVLLLANHLNPGGVAAYCLMVARHLNRLGCEVSIASGGGRWEKLAERDGIRHHRVPMHTSSELNPKLLFACRDVARLVRSEDIRILHDQTRVAQVVAAAAARGTGARRVSTCHGYFKTRFFRRLFPLWGEKVIAVSDAVGEHLSKDWKLPADRVRVIPHGLEVAPDAPERDGTVAEARRRRGAAPDQIVVAAVGRFSPVKGYDVLVRAMARLKDLPVRAWIAGEGPEQSRLERLIGGPGGAANTSLLEPLDDASEIRASADIFCVPSIQEGFGLSALEAMGAGLPVVASRVGALPSLIQDGRTGVLVEPGDDAGLADAIRRLSGDAALRARLGEAARNYVREKFPIETMMRRTLDVYRELA